MNEQGTESGSWQHRVFINRCREDNKVFIIAKKNLNLPSFHRGTAARGRKKAGSGGKIP
jgi:hypothetical protein